MSFYAKLCKNGRIKVNQLELSNAEVLQALRSYVKIERGFSLRDFYKLFLNYPILQELDGRIVESLSEYRKAPKIGCANREFAALVYRHSLVLDGEDDILHFSISKELFGQAASGEFLPIRNSSLNSLLDLPLYHGLAQIEQVNSDSEYASVPAVSDMVPCLFEFVVELAGCIHSMKVTPEELKQVAGSSAWASLLPNDD